MATHTSMPQNKAPPLHPIPSEQHAAHPDTASGAAIYGHADALAVLNGRMPPSEKLCEIHKLLKGRFPFVDRIAIAIYDARSDLLKTYMHSSNGDQPLSNYETKLCNARSLLEILERGHPRVVNDLSIFSGGAREHTKRIKAQGYGASYTIPMYLNGKFIGFLFFNSYEKDVFREEALHYLDIFGHLISLFVINELNNIRTLIASVETTVGIVHQRDFETGSHLDRMSNYAKLIASTLAGRHNLSDEAIEHIFLFAVLHDVGKIAIPDNILLKAGKLDAQEFDLMKNHVSVGLEIIDSMLQNFGIDDMQHVSVLRNIVHCHHEAVNGSGYPQGLQGDEIPVEARIVAVADAFDALTSKRPYKEAWSNEEAFSALLDLCGTKFDHDCVEALISKRADVERIQKRFNEAP